MLLSPLPGISGRTGANLMNPLYNVFLKIDLFDDWITKGELNFQATSKL